MRACIIPSNACLILSVGIDPVSSCSSMTVSSCRSRAAHPRVKEPAVAACAIMPMTNVASIHGIRRGGDILGMTNLHDASGQSKFIGQSQTSGGRQVAGRPENRPPPVPDCHYSKAESRASMERMVGSGSEPTYLPLTNTSYAGLLLCCLGPANALEATLIMRAIASPVLVNMVEAPVGLSVTPHSVCVHLGHARRPRESPGGLVTVHRERRIERCLEGL